MKLYRLFTLSIAVLGVVVLQSCTKDFDEINKNPNAIDINKDYPDKLLANAIEDIADRVFDVWLGHEIGSCWVQHMA
ncbi:MAG TPA: hypothetical protein PLF12_11910, partial [Tenuifilum sp.]|nr:hypothetical protein [Tenuifilum sp.]HOK87046.1 hypothetical protein [Tenuifilum sp.]